MSVTMLGIVLVALGFMAFAGFVQGDFDTVPEGVTWMRQILEENIVG
jgi:hypothetical protein